MPKTATKTATAPAVVLSFPTLIAGIKLDAGETAGSVESWIQIAVTGKFEDPRYGKFSITKAQLAQMADNFNEGKFPEPPTEICVDYEHLTAKEDISPGDTKAAAWFRELELRADGEELWARVEWTPDAAEQVKKKEYRFFSPHFTTKFTDIHGKELGATLINGAITNTPFLQGMQPLALRLSAQRSKALHIKLTVSSDNEKRTLLEQAIRQQFGTWKDDGYGYRYCDTWLIDTNDQAEAIFSKDGARMIVGYTIADDGTVTFDGEPAAAVTSYTRLSVSAQGGTSLMAKIKLTAANGTAFEIDQDQLEQLPFVKELKAKVPGEGQKVVNTAEFDALDASVKTLKTSVETLQTENKATKDTLLERDAQAAVGALLSAGKILPASKDKFIALYKKDKESFEGITADMPVVVKLTGVPKGGDGGGEEAGDVIEQVKQLAVKARTEHPELKTEEAAIEHVLKADRKLYERYSAANTTKV